MAPLMMGTDLPCPPSVAVVGGGRWARVLLDVLSGLLPASVELSAHSASNATGMAEWAKGKGLAQRLRVSAVPPNGAAAVLIANAARYHEAAAASALDAGAFTLLEKPLAPDAAGAQRILARGGRLAASQVFRYARYVDLLARRAAEAGALESLSIRWTDSAAESRYGEPVRHDPDLPFAGDVLPHVCALVEAVAGKPPSALRSAVQEGESQRIALEASGIPIDLRLRRAGSARERVVEARAGGRLITLDFSTEPGTVSWDGRGEIGDPAWNAKPRPVASMLTAFLGWAAGGPKDIRLEPATGLLSCRLADDAVRRLG